MATTNLYLDLARSTKWLTRDNDNSAVQGAFEQKQQNLPEVIWNLNAVPFSNGIKALTPADEPNLPDFPPAASISNLWTITSLLDTKGNLTYLILDDNVTIGSQRKFYYWSGEDWQLLVEDFVGIFHFFHRKTTVFQTSNVFVLTSGDRFGDGITVQGDTPNDNSLFTVDISTATVEVYNLTGILLSGADRKNGISSFQNYLLFWDTRRIYWSSPIDFTDFTPSVGGGGSTQISEAKGDVITIVPNPTGLMIYCKTNIVHAAFSGDSSNPWVFREVPGSSGIQIEDGNPVVTLNETAPYQVFMGANGLQLVTDSSVQSIDDISREFNDTNTSEQKAEGSCEVVQLTYVQPSKSPTKVRKLVIDGSNLFIFSGETVTTVPEYPENRLFILNTSTGQIAKLDGDYISLYPRLNLAKDIDGGDDLYNKVDVFPNQYLAGRRVEHLIDRVPLVLDLAGGIERVLGSISQSTGYRQAEILIGLVSATRSSTTILHSVKLDGQFQYKVDDLSRAKVFAYSKSTLGATNPVEFIFNPIDQRHYGFIEGKDLMVEVRGDHFYLVGIAVEVERGGDY